MTCIICLGENEISDENPLTDEHIVPEFIGGNLVVKNVCKTCNCNLGSGFEGRLANNFYFQLARQVHDIKGKQLSAPNAFIGTYEHAELGKVRVDDKNNMIVFPEIDIDQQDSKFSISLRIDKTEQRQAKKMLRTKLQRHFKNQGKTVSKNQLEQLESHFWENATISKRSVEKPQFTGNFVWDVNDHNLLHLKIAYELLIYHFGNSYLQDQTADKIRLSLKNQQMLDDVSFTNQLELSELTSLFDDQNHWAYIVRNFCVVSIFGQLSSVIFTDSISDFYEVQGVVYKFDIKSGKHEKMSLFALMK